MAEKISFDFSSLEFSPNFQDAFSTKKEKEFVSKARVNHKPVLYKNALEMAEQIDITQDYFAMVSGGFIFGDFLEAIMDIHDLEPERVMISTLGMNKNNVDSIVNMVDYLGAKRVGLVVSGYFYGVERRGLIPYIVSEFRDKPISVGVCASHTKITLIDSEKSRFTIFGSANLSSSNNLEEFALIHDDGVYDFCNKILSGILNKFRFFDGPSNMQKFDFNKQNTGKKIYKTVEESIKE